MDFHINLKENMHASGDQRSIIQPKVFYSFRSTKEPFTTDALVLQGSPTSFSSPSLSSKAKHHTLKLTFHSCSQALGKLEAEDDGEDNGEMKGVVRRKVEWRRKTMEEMAVTKGR